MEQAIDLGMWRGDERSVVTTRRYKSRERLPGFMRQTDAICLLQLFNRQGEQLCESAGLLVRRGMISLRDALLVGLSAWLRILRPLRVNHIAG